ncbi:hypothetical protein, variant [Phialophora macrospora]|uniref:Uncharacterized protein n=1 Tax=Phialophora macrospora TaxID=1851006 RepID=A0A0D2G9Z4_9EURO|nr:hypothetical protein PV04_04695 [Phialophora macrospora]KIW68774.1 hypothetical protein, variant [Phialophora macrospora]
MPRTFATSVEEISGWIGGATMATIKFDMKHADQATLEISTIFLPRSRFQSKHLPTSKSCLEPIIQTRLRRMGGLVFRVDVLGRRECCKERWICDLLPIILAAQGSP